MKQLLFTKQNNPSRLHDELLAAIPELQQTTRGLDGRNEALPENMRVESDGTTVWLTVPDDADEAAIDAVIASHAVPVVMPTEIISYVEFEARFTDAEKPAVTQYIFAVSPTSGQSLYPDLIQALNRAVARNTVDLLSPATDALLGILVTAAVITAARKEAILTP